MEWLLLLLCPLMMIFMMKGMHANSHNDHNNQETKNEVENLKKQNELLSTELSNLKSKLK